MNESEALDAFNSSILSMSSIKALLISSPIDMMLCFQTNSNKRRAFATSRANADNAGAMLLEAHTFGE